MTVPRPRITHELKTWPEFFNQTRSDRKRFELRQADRDFRVGDHLLLREWDPAPSEPCTCDDDPMKCQRHAWEVDQTPKGYTGRELLLRVDYIMSSEDIAAIGATFIDPVYPLAASFVIMSISHVH